MHYNEAVIGAELAALHMQFVSQHAIAAPSFAPAAGQLHSEDTIASADWSKQLLCDSRSSSRNSHDRVHAARSLAKGDLGKAIGSGLLAEHSKK